MFKVVPTNLMLTAILILAVVISTTSAADDDTEKNLSTELALIASWLDGQPYEAYVREHILTPLGLNDTDTGFPTDAGDHVLSTNTLREMQQVHWMDWDWETSWGLAFGIYRKGERTLTGHGGSCPGFNTRIYIDPISLYGVTVMANRNHVNVNGYASMMLDILEAEGTPDEYPENTGPKLADYLGG